jgi:hypothetical protein
MAQIGPIRGALLEEAVLFLLDKAGYKVIYRAEDSSELSGIRNGRSGLELRGRGTWHQIDALAECDTSPAFMYPLRLILEAKFYSNTRIQLGAVRSFFGVEKDISENYFTKRVGADEFSEIRFNYRAAMLSVYGYTSGAVEFAVAHQIFLIEYNNIPVIAPVIDAIASFDNACVTAAGFDAMAAVRAVLRSTLRVGAMPVDTRQYVTDAGLELINEGVAQAVLRIGGSYFGMLQGRWPIHFLTERPISPAAVVSDRIECRLSGNQQGQWSFSPIGVQENSERWFKLQFSLPPELARRISDRWGDPVAVANEKADNFSFVNLSGVIGGIRRTIRLELSREWLQQYLASVRP